MKLKPVTTALFLLFSGAAFAGTTSTTQAQLDSMQAELNHMQQLINQNGGGTTSMGGTSLQQTLATSSDWSNAISISGLANVDAIFSNRTPVVAGNTALAPASLSTAPNSSFGYNSSSNIQLTNADVFVDAQINDWTKAHFGFNYNNNISYPSQIVGDHSTDSSAGLGVDEAYVTIGNFTENPFYFRAGKQYVNFGNYDRFAAVPTFTQLLSETNATAATVGFVSNGFYGSFFGFRGAANTANPTTVNVNNFGANVGLSNQSSDLGYNLGLSYLNNMNDVDYVATTSANVNKVSGVSADATMNMGMFDAGAHFVTAANSFNSISTTTDSGLTTTTAKPKALVVGGGVSFPVMNHNSRFGVDYQHSWQAENVGLYGLPQQRYEGTYNVEWSKNVNVGLDLFTDRDYSVTNGGSGAAVTTGLVRLGVMFA